MSELKKIKGITLSEIMLGGVAVYSRKKVEDLWRSSDQKNEAGTGCSLAVNATYTN